MHPLPPHSGQGGTGFNMKLEVKSFPKYLTPWGSEWSISHTPPQTKEEEKLWPPYRGGFGGMGAPLINTPIIHFIAGSESVKILRPKVQLQCRSLLRIMETDKQADERADE